MNTIENKETEIPQVGSAVVADARQKSMKYRQYAYAELGKKKGPTLIMQELISMGMDKTEASKLIEGMLKQTELDTYYEDRDDPNKWSAKTNIIMGVVSVFSGFGLSLILGIFASIGFNTHIVIPIGIIGIGIALIVRGVGLKKKEKNHRK